jgi:hypothetical protein
MWTGLKTGLCNFFSVQIYRKDTSEGSTEKVELCCGILLIRETHKHLLYRQGSLLRRCDEIYFGNFGGTTFSGYHPSSSTLKIETQLSSKCWYLCTQIHIGKDQYITKTTFIDCSFYMLQNNTVTDLH